MNAKTRQYLFGVIFIAVAIYQATVRDYLEFTLYAVAGMAFVVNALTLEPKLITYKKTLVILTWILIAGAAVIFLYLLQFKF
jgi:hypothetical protein